MRCIMIALFTLAANVSNAWAWGDTGHRVVCEIAFRISAPEIRTEIRRLIQMDSEFDFFRDSCIWPDHPRKRGRGRDASYLAPPAQSRTCGFPAYGSHRGYLTLNLCRGQGWMIRGRGSHCRAISFILGQSNLSR